MPGPLPLVLPWIAAAAASTCALWLARARRRDLGAHRAELRAGEAARSQSEARVRTLVERAAYGIYTATA
ncbi:MAG TPA: hypothetical protein VFX39_02715, partial [Gemmatimonadaceae bacterium]|nr:hypothetical protein [Gemmatimonadaceae bacterium]